MNVCISGASGFIGNKLLKYHLALGHRVRYLTRSATKKIPGAQAFVSNVAGSVDLLASFLEGADVFYHCAGEISNEALMREAHVLGTQQLLLAIDELQNPHQKAFQWVQLSSCGAYGQPDARPISSRLVSEETKEEPKGEYEITKTESDYLVMNYARGNSNFNYTIIRPTIVFGIGMRSTALKRLSGIIKRGAFFYVRDKEAIANYVHIDDVISAMLLSTNNKTAFNQTFIVANDCKYQVVVDAIADVLRVKNPSFVINEALLRKVMFIATVFLRRLPITQGHIDVMVRKTTYNNRKLKATLGWTPSGPIAKQIADVVKGDIN